MRTSFIVAIAAVLVHAGAGAAAAQSSVTPLEAPGASTPPPGWSFTPAIDYALVWDSNVLMENVGSTIVSEQLHVLKPRGTLSFSGRRGGLSANYGGAFVQHPTLSSLNSFDQRVGVNASRAMTRRLSLSTRYGFTSSPTTELVELVGVPFARIGTRRHEAMAGVTSLLSRKTELQAAYRFQRIHFDNELSTATVVNGGQSHGGTLGLKHKVTERLAVTGDYFFDRATFASGSTFVLQNGWAGLEYAINSETRAFGSGGVSYLSGIDGRPARSGPALRVGVARDVQNATVSVSYTRSYVPSYGFGGTSNNEELRTILRVPISRRFFTESALSVRRNEPLETSGLTLRSTWYHASLGYALADWARIEGYTAGSRQNIARPDGRVNRYSFGVQITAATTTRIR